MEVLLLIHIFDDITKKTWMKIFGIFILHCIFSFIDYSFLYTNERSAYIYEWINPTYLVEFIVIGVIGCVLLCKQRLRAFSSSIINSESIIVLLINMVFILFVIIVGKMIGRYEINWIGVLNRSLFCYVFVGISEEWIYRGFIVTQMKKVVKREIIIIIGSAILFSLMHLPSYLIYTEVITFGGVVYRLLIPLLMGLVYAYIYMCNGNLFIIIVLHGSYDLIENIAFDSWYYVAYGICWLLMLGYSVYCYKKKKKHLIMNV